MDAMAPVDAKDCLSVSDTDFQEESQSPSSKLSDFGTRSEKSSITDESQSPDFTGLPIHHQNSNCIMATLPYKTIMFSTDTTDTANRSSFSSSSGSERTCDLRGLEDNLVNPL
jgi:hypothetical protein